MNVNTGQPLDDISAESLPVIAALGCDATKVSEIIASKNKAVYDAIQKGIDESNKEAISNAQKV